MHVIKVLDALCCIGVLKMIETQFKYVQKCRHEINTNAQSRISTSNAAATTALLSLQGQGWEGRTDGRGKRRPARPPGPTCMNIGPVRERDGGGGGGRTEGRWPDGMRSLLSRCDIWLYSHAPADLVIWLTTMFFVKQTYTYNMIVHGNVPREEECMCAGP